MKNKLFLVFIFFLFFSFVFTSVSIAQLRISNPNPEHLKNMIKIKGWVAYYVLKEVGNENILDAQMDVILKENDKYEIKVLKLNGIKFRYHFERVYYDYMLFKRSFNAAVGDILELKVGIVKKGATVLEKNIKYYTVAKFKINNLYEKFEFPHPDQTINLTLTQTPFITFKWKFTDFNQKSAIQISSLGAKSIQKKVSGEYCKIKKSDLVSYKTYRIKIGAYWGPQDKFTFTKYVSRDSKLTFSHNYSINFKTRKIEKKLIISEIK